MLGEIKRSMLSRTIIVVILLLYIIRLNQANYYPKMSIEQNQTIVSAPPSQEWDKISDGKNRTNTKRVKFTEKFPKSTNESRRKRDFSQFVDYSDKSWITKEFPGKDEILNMHAFVVRDETIGSCCQPTLPDSPGRYFMCSGAILTLRHAITTASCIHLADTYESHFRRADLAVLVGAFTLTPYVIKINRYEMHPKYVFEIDSPQHSKHNVAILFLNCGFVPNSVTVPKLPKGIFDDIGHLCCGRSCDLITIVQYPDNHHVAKILNTKHLPSPQHDEFFNLGPENRSNMMRSQNIYKNTSTSIRRTRSSGKLAGTPSYFLKNLRTESTVKPEKSVKNQNPKRTRIDNIFDEIANAKKKANYTRSLNERSLNMTNQTKHPMKPNIHSTENFQKLHKNPTDRKLWNFWGEAFDLALFKLHSNFSNIAKDLQSVDWGRVEEELTKEFSDSNKTKMDDFAQKLVDATVKKLKIILGDKDFGIKMEALRTTDQHNLHEDLKQGFIAQHLPPSNGTAVLKDFATVFATVLQSVIPPYSKDNLTVSSDLIVEKNELIPPPPKNLHCPPLGTPVIKDNILVAMVTYTCDDAQNWVAWKYVSLSENMMWIRKRIAITQHQPPVSCDMPFGALRQGGDFVPIREQLKSTSERKLREFLPEFEKKYQQTNHEYLNLAAQSPRHYANMYNPQMAHGHLPKAGSTTQEPLMKPNYNGFSAVSNINANTCFTKPDGSTDCRSITNTYTVL